MEPFYRQYNMQVAYEPRSGGNPLGAGIIMELSENEFLLTGTMCTISFFSNPEEAAKTEILRLEERGIVGHFEGSKPRQLLITKEQWQSMQSGQQMTIPEEDYNPPVEEEIP